MAGLREQDIRPHIGSEDVPLVISTIEEEGKLSFRVILHHAAEDLDGKPSDPFRTTGQEQPGIDRDMFQGLTQFPVSI